MILVDACSQNNTTKLRVSVAAGARPKTEHLMSACGWKATAVVIALIDEHAVSTNGAPIDPNITPYNYGPMTPLDKATRAFRIETIEVLLARGAKPYLREATYFRSFLFDPVVFAMFHARELLVPFVERGFHLEGSRFMPRTALGFAVRFGCISTVKLLLKHGSDVNQRQRCNGMTPLHECCKRCGNIEMMTVLLEAGADVDLYNWYDLTPLQLAMCRGDVEAVRLLVLGLVPYAYVFGRCSGAIPADH